MLAHRANEQFMWLPSPIGTEAFELLAIHPNRQPLSYSPTTTKPHAYVEKVGRFVEYETPA